MSRVKLTQVLANTNNKCYYSIEVSPGFVLKDVCKLKKEPLFYSVTWHAKNLRKFPENDSINLARDLLSLGKNVVLHLSCDEMTVDYLKVLLDYFIEIGLMNLLLVRGDDFNSKNSDFHNTKDLIKHITTEYKGEFCIGVVGLPDSNKIEELNEKIKIGANFVITQASNDATSYIRFADDCKAIGNVPIIFGIFPFDSNEAYGRFAMKCKISIKEDGSKNVTELLQQIMDLDSGEKRIFHFFSLNQFDKLNIVWDKFNE